MNAKTKIWEYLITHNNVATNAALAEMLRGQPGQLSIGQRLRELRKELQAKGNDLRCTEVRKGIYKYEVIYNKEPLILT